MDDLIGVPFKYGGRGPDTFDCYGLLMKLYKDEHGVDLPDIRSGDNLHTIAAQMAGRLHLYEEVKKQPGTIILFKVRGMASHVGYYLGKDKFIHTWEQSGGVVIERLSTWDKRIIGFYKYVG